jgi:ABC-type amino acid transport substrate-binding protein
VERSASASSLKDLTGRTLAVETGSEGDTRARWLARRTVGLRVLQRDSANAAMQAVESSQADAAITDTAVARQYGARHPDLHIGQRQTSSPYVLTVRVEDHDLLHALDRVLAQVKADGTLEQIIARWLDK